MAQTQTASQFYMAYRSAFDKAKKIEELFRSWRRRTLDQVNQTPAADRAKRCSR
jgi:hypothetical protein